MSAASRRRRSRSRLQSKGRFFGVKFIETLEQRLMLDAVSWKSTSSGSWDVAGNWSTGKVPTASDDVTISQSGVTVTVSGSDAAHSLTSAGALVVASGSLTLGADSSTTAALTIDAGAKLTTNGTLTLSGDTADNSGTLAVVGGLSFAGATLTNAASGTIDLHADVGFAAASGTNTLHNAGLLEKSAGTGTSTVAIDLDNTGTVHAKSGTLSLTGAITQVSSGTLTGGTWDVDNNAALNFGSTANLSTNQATVNLAGPNATFTQFATVTNMGGSVSLTGGQNFSAAGDMTISGSLSLDTGTLSLNNHALTIQSGGSLTFGGASGISGASQITDSGTLVYNGTGTATLASTFNLNSGTVKVNSGNLALAGGFGTETGGTYNVASGAVLDLNGGSSGDTFTGTFTGTGAGPVQLNSGSIQIGGSGATFDFPKGQFQWTGGSIANAGGTLTNPGFITIDTASGASLNVPLTNQGEIDDAGTGSLNVFSSLDNQAKATFVIQNTGGVGGNGSFSNEGTLKMTGSGTATESPTFNLTGGTVEVDSGNLTLAGGFGTETGGAYNVASGSVLDLTGGSSGDTFTGTFNGTGAGTVQFSGGGINIGGGGATFNFAKGLFQWTGGTIANASNVSPTLTNTGFITIDTTSGVTLGTTSIVNQGEIDDTNTGAFTVNGPLDNQANAKFVIQSTGGLNGGATFSNEGLLKMTGGGTATVQAPFDLKGGTVEVDSGKLALGGGNSGAGTNTGGNYVVNSGAVLDLNGGEEGSYTGTFTGTGGGQVLVNGGALAIGPSGATFDFAKGMLLWTGGQISNAGPAPTFTNTGFMTINALATTTIGIPFVNQGEIDVIGGGGMGIDGPFDNQATGSIVFANSGSFGIGSGAGSAISNEGTIKMTGSGATTLNLQVNSNDGTIEADGGDLTLVNFASGSTFTGGDVVVNQGATVDLSAISITCTGTSFTVAAGATLDLGGATMNGSFTGAGTVNFSSITVAIGGVVADLGNFNWTGGGINTALGDLTNLGAMTLSGSNEHELYNDGMLDNRGTIIQSGTGNFGLHSDGQFPTTLKNEAGAVYQITADSGFDNPVGGSTALVNAGLIEKTAGSGTSTLLINGSISNTGTIEADSGTLALSGTIAQFTADGDLTAGAWNAMNGAHLALPDNIITNHASITLSGAGASVGGSFGLTFIGLSALQANAGSLTLTGGAAVATIRQHFNGPNGTQLTATGDLTNSGTLTVGPGSTLTLADIYTQTSAGTLDIGLGGSPAGGQFGQVVVTAAATLGGTLQLAPSGNYSPSDGDSFPVLKFGSSTGSFSAITGPQYHGGNLFQAQTNATNVTVTAATAVADLSVTSATLVTTNAQAGQPVSVNYQVTNSGVATVATTWQDAVFVSTHATLDSSAVLLGHVTHTGAVATNGNYSGTLTAPLPLLLPGSYHVFVEADSQGIVPDANRVNNTLASMGSFSVTVPILPLSPSTGNAQYTDFTLSQGQEQIFQLNVPAGDDVQIAGYHSEGVGIQVLAALGAVPTSSNSVPNYVGYEYYTPSTATIDSAQGGTYYITVTYPSGAAFTSDKIELAAQEVPFAVTGLSPIQALNVGPVTLTITGDQFTPQTTVSLTTGQFGKTIAASSVTFDNSTTLQATFNLLNVPQGDYSVQISDHGKTFSTTADPYSPLDFIDANFGYVPPLLSLQVDDSGGFASYYNAADPAEWGMNTSIISSVSAPSAVRTGRINTLSVNYYSEAYEGDRVAAPLFILSSDNAEFQLPGQTGFTSGSIMLLGIDNTGDGSVAGSLPGTRTPPIPNLAGGSVGPLENAPLAFGRFPEGSLNVNFIATSAGPVNFELNVADPNAGIDWSTLKSSLEPPGMPGAAWDAIFANFTAKVGDTLGQLQSVLDQDASYLAQIGEPTADVNTLLDFELQQDGDYGAIAQRYTQGIFGLGIQDPTMTAVTDSQGNVEIVAGSTARQFTLQPDGSYAGVPGDAATLKLVDAAYQLRETDGTLEVFNANGSLNYFDDANGNELVYGYTGKQLTSLTNTATGDVTTLAYNSQGLVSQITDPEGRVTSLQYDSSAHLLSVAAPLGTTSYTYVTSGTPQQLNAIASITNPNGSQVLFNYDDQGRLIGQSLNAGAEPLTFAYNVGSITTTDTLKESTTEFLNENGQVAEIVDPLGNIEQGTFNAAQQPVSIAAPGGLTSSIAYGALGKPISFIDPLGQQTTATYNSSFGGLQTLTDPAGNSLNYSYDPTNGNLRSIAYPDGSNQQYAYNALGQVTQFITRGGQVVGYTYFPDGMLESETLSDGTQNTFAYDTHRNLVSMTDSTGTTTFSYDSADRLTKVSYPDGTFLAYTYNSAGQRTQMQDQTGFTVNYAYSSLGQLAKLTDGGGKLIVSYEYDLAGRIASENFGNGTSTQFTYDANDNVLSIVNLAPDGSTQSSYVYTYNDQNLPVTMTTAAGKFTYGYDADGQLVSVQTPSGESISYQYDAAGNRVAVVTNGQSTAYASNDLNEYTQAGDTTYQYDANGNLVASTNSSGTTGYDYNVLGQLVSVVSPSGTTTYQYNGLGQLVSEDVNGTVTNLLNDPTAYGTVVGQFSAGGSPLAQYAYGLGLVSQTTAGGSSNFYGFDAAGSTTQLTGPTGGVLNAYSYLPFGEQISATGTAANPFTYGGQLGVMAGAGASGLFHMGYRWYDSGLGRFDQPDPTGIGGGDTNLYRYVGNSPVNDRDPSGLQANNGDVVNLTPQETSAIVGIGSGVGGTTILAGGAAYLTAASGATVASGVTGAAFTSTTVTVATTVAQTNAYGETLAWTAQTVNTTLTTTTSTSIVGVTGEAGGTALAGATAEATGVGATVLTSSAAAVVGTVGVAAVGGVLVGTAINHIPGVPEGVQTAIHYYLPNLGQSNQDVLSDAAKKRLVDGFKPQSGANSISATPQDPNDITGPAGFGSQAFVSGTASLPYRIDFENQPTATAAADTVTVTQQLDPNLDLTTFQLGNIGFGNTVVQVPAGLQSYHTRVTLPSTAPGAGSNGLLVDVSASLNVQTGLVTWTLTSLDPASMDSPLSPAEGLLPPDDANGDGEGFVSYTVQAKSTAKTGTAVNAQATVVFDTNAPLSTAPISNTIDAAAPTSSVAALPTDSPPKFTVSWSGTDDAGGSGIASYNVYVSDNNAPYTPLLTKTTDTSTVFTGQVGHTYVFFSVATDNAGNVEANPIHGQAITTVATTLPTSTVNVLPSVSPLSFTVAWSASGLGGPGAPTFSVFVSDNGGPFTAFQTATTATSATFTGQAGHSYGFYSVVTDSVGNVQTTPTAAQATTSLPSDLNSLYVTAVFLDVLGRTPDAGGLQFWTQQLDGGTAVSSVAQAIAHSAEYYQKFVIEPDYLKLLGRAADSAGIQFWVAQMQGGLTDQELEAGFVASDEFFTKAGGTNTDWVDAVFQLLLGRPPDQGGQTFWDAQLAAGVSRSQAALGIANSQENNTNLINADYFHYLGRAADPGGLDFWLAQFAAGQTNEDVIAGFTGSAEYYKKHTTGG